MNNNFSQWNVIGDAHIQYEYDSVLFPVNFRTYKIHQIDQQIILFIHFFHFFSNLSIYLSIYSIIPIYFPVVSRCIFLVLVYVHSFLVTRFFFRYGWLADATARYPIQTRLPGRENNIGICGSSHPQTKWHRYNTWCYK